MPLSVCNSVQNVLIATMLVTLSAGKEKAIRLYEFQPDSGKLVQHEQYNLPGSPGSQFVSPDGQRLYVSVRSANSVAAFHIDKVKKNWFHLAQTTSAQTQHM
ncbi:MAG TPA: hypothetical protein DCO70_01945 [Verrucomicrobiales bacterium]|nr:hypothetical protein [Verrucomicrobiales bacterium]|tara:strand:- start:408 stop:713 length:306 start_codon:yes stop_codon:yes gene_type:complete